MNESQTLRIRPAITTDCGAILQFIIALARYEKLEHLVVATEAAIAASLFGDQPAAEVLIAEWATVPAGFALFFPNYSTFLAQKGMYLEDLFVYPGFRGKGIGKALLQSLAALAVERDCGRLDWSVLDWNKPAIDFYLQIGARALDDWMLYRLDGAALKRMAGQGTMPA